MNTKGKIMRFEVFGPFDVLKYDRGLLASTGPDQREFWTGIDAEVPNLPDACGCYILSIRGSNGAKPWYVGKAERTSFKKECLSLHKINHINNLIVDGGKIRRVRPQLTLIAAVTDTGKFRKCAKTKNTTIDALERILIGMALKRNPELRNSKGTKYLRELTVDGFLNSRLARSGPSSDLRKLMGT